MKLKITDQALQATTPLTDRPRLRKRGFMVGADTAYGKLLTYDTAGDYFVRDVIFTIITKRRPNLTTTGTEVWCYHA